MTDGRVIHVVPRIHDEASGPSYSVVRLCQSLIHKGEDVRLAVMEPVPEKQDFEFICAFPYGFGPRLLAVSPSMKRWLREQAVSGKAAVIHNHSLWIMPNMYPGDAVRGTACKLVLAPRGTLSSWALSHSALKKRLMWWWRQKRVLERAHAFHATSMTELEEIRALGFRQPVAVIPNGIDIPSPDEKKTRRQVLFLSRIHPKKGLPLLLEAWGRIEKDFPDWELIIAGPDERGHLAELRNLAGALSLTRCVFPGPLLGDDKLAAYRTASLFVLPSHSENFGMVVAEALAAGTPAIVTKGAPWAGLEREGAGWWVDISVDSLEMAMRSAMAKSPEELKQMGRRGREWMKRDFSWDRIAADMAAFYDWLLHGGEQPSFVRMD